MKVIIIGGGQVGSHIANLLVENGNEVKIIERREVVINKLLKAFPKEMIVVGNGTDASVLELADIQNTDVVVAVSGADEVNLVSSTIAKFEYGINRVIARVNNPKNDWLFDIGMGVDIKVSQADMLARIIIDEIDLKNMYTLMKLNQGIHSIIQVKIDPHATSAHKQIKDIDLPNDTVLIAILRDHEVIIPSGDTEILANDQVMALTTDEGQKKLNKLFVG